MIPQVWRAYWEKQKVKKYEPDANKPVGMWYAKGVWTCNCWANLDDRRHGDDVLVCPDCECQRPID